jgi:hypothetical protein
VQRSTGLARLVGRRRLASFGPRLICTKCGMVDADVRPNWNERGSALADSGPCTPIKRFTS